MEIPNGGDHQGDSLVRFNGSNHKGNSFSTNLELNVQGSLIIVQLFLQHFLDQSVSVADSIWTVLYVHTMISITNAIVCEKYTSNPCIQDTLETCLYNVSG